MRFVAAGFFWLTAFFADAAEAAAHEVYVLEPHIAEGLVQGSSPNPLSIIGSDPVHFLLWGFIAIVTVLAVFLISISRKLEEVIDPILFRYKKPYGLLVGRATLGLGLMACGYFSALFGPELPLSSMVGLWLDSFVSVALMVVGGCILAGFLTRSMCFAALGLFALAVFQHGPYMLTYTNYFGEMLVMAVLGQHVLSIDRDVLHWQGRIDRFSRFVEKYGFLILRVTFGISLIFASFYAKFLHSNLALQTVLDYNLTAYFPFDPLFIVLGAFIIEVLLGIFFIIGFEIRFSAIFLLVFLTLSLLYFGEAVWPHLILVGVPLALFIHGYDRYTLEGRFLKDAKHEPVL